MHTGSGPESAVEEPEMVDAAPEADAEAGATQSQVIEPDEKASADAGAEEAAEAVSFPPAFLWDRAPYPVVATSADFELGADGGNFLKGVKWSPDGTCLLTSSEDRTLRIFELPRSEFLEPPETAELDPWSGADVSLRAAVKAVEGETVYDYAWFPYMNSQDPATCCFAVTCRDHPIRLRDAFTGAVRGSYAAYDDAEQLTAAYCLTFDSFAKRLYCGFNNCIRVFELERPGRANRRLATYRRANKQQYGMKGIISCLSFNPDCSGTYAAGSFSKTIGIYSESADTRNGPQLLLEGHAGGVTQVAWSPNGVHLFSGARKDNEILCWDTRAAGSPPVLRFPRVCETNQRLQFDLDASGRYLVTPSQDGSIRIYDVCDGGKLIQSVDCNGGCPNGAALHPSLPFLAASTGKRLFRLPSHLQLGPDDMEGEDVFASGTDATSTAPPTPMEHALVVWRCQANPELAVAVQKHAEAQAAAAAAAATVVVSDPGPDPEPAAEPVTEPEPMQT